MRSRFSSVLLAGVMLWACWSVPASSQDLVEGGLCDAGSPHLVFVTTAGQIRIELLVDAGPQTVKRLVQLVEGPLYSESAVGSSPPAADVGFFDGLAFEYTNPNIEIITSTRQPAELFELETAIDAESLGLHEDLVEDAGEAMDVMQFELAGERDRLKKRGGMQGQLELWFNELYESGNADFLIGTSRKTINEAIGYSYVQGLESRPPTRGMVALRPASRNTANVQLSILLTDFPKRTGRWMVIGRVTEGLDVARDVSRQPLLGPPGWRNRAFTPRSPVLIERVDFECSGSDHGTEEE